MAKINETNYPRRQASEYAPTDMLIVQPVPDPEQEHSGDSRTTRVSDLKDYMLGDADPSKIGTPAAGTYTSASNTNAQNIAALDHALANYDHLTKRIATQAEINGYIADPTTADFNVIYLLKDTSATGSDKYFEYMRLGTPESSIFEMTGDTSTDLSDYYTKNEVNTALADKVNKSSTVGLLKNDGTVDTNSYATSAEAFKTSDTAETAIADDDYIPFYDSSASAKRKSLWNNIKSVLKTYFDGIYLTSHQTVKQDGVTGATVNRFGTCSTAAAAAAKTVSITTGTFSLEAGARVSVKFSIANTANTPTLNVNGTGAKNIFYRGNQITTGPYKYLLTGVCEFIYDGMQWHFISGTDTDVVTSSSTSSGVTTHSQGIGLNGVDIIDIEGTLYMQQTLTQSTAGDKTFTFSNPAITTSSIIDVYATDGKSYKSITTASGSVSIVYTMAASESLSVRIYIR